MVVSLGRHTLLSLDNCLDITQSSIPYPKTVGAAFPAR